MLARPKTGLFTDARDYYRAFYTMRPKGLRAIFYCPGGKFDSNVDLQRGEDAVG